MLKTNCDLFGIFPVQDVAFYILFDDFEESVSTLIFCRIQMNVGASYQKNGNNLNDFISNSITQKFNIYVFLDNLNKDHGFFW